MFANKSKMIRKKAIAFLAFPFQFIKFAWLAVFLLSLSSFSALSQGCWTQVANMPQARYNAVSFTIGELAYVLTGQSSGGTWRDEFFEYNPNTNTWTQLSDFPGTPRTGAAGFSINGKGYIGTGRDDNGNTNDFWEYDPLTNLWTQKANYPPGNYEAATGFSIGDKGYIGLGLSWSTAQRTFYEYDPLTDTWTQKADFPVATGRHTAVGFSIDDKGYVGTGYHSGFTRNNDFWEYDPATNTWLQLANVPGPARAGAVGFSAAGKGYVGTGNQYSDFYSYEVSSNTWTQITSYGPGNRDDAACFVLNDIPYVGGGFYLSIKSDWWKLDSPAIQVETPITGCDSVIFNSVVYNASETIETVVPGAALNGCDSIYIQDIVISNSISVELPVLAECDSVLFAGVYYQEDTTLYQYLSSQLSGCDSTVSVNLNVLHSATGTDTQTACNSFTWLDGITYTERDSTATFNLEGAAANGCDSLLTLDLTILGPVSAIDTQVACNSYTWLDGITYTANDSTATYTLEGAAANGCDSLLTLNLTLLGPVAGIDTQVACNSYTWLDGITYTANDSTATYTLEGAAANGCDSLLTLNLTINAVSDLSISLDSLGLFANNANASAFQWLDCDTGLSSIPGETSSHFSPTSDGNYAVQLTENGCTTISDCVSFILTGIVENTFREDITVFPNPSSGHFTLQFERAQENLILQLYSLTGKFIESKSFPQAALIEFSIDQEPGIYLLEIYNGDGDKAVIRLIKS